VNALGVLELAFGLVTEPVVLAALVMYVAVVLLEELA
jgi:hypothetical protein